MSARGNEAQYHRVRVVIDDSDPEWPTIDELRFTCTAPEDADCRTYPDCECEVFTEGDQAAHDASGHPYVPGRECWVKTWFEVGPECVIYVGDDVEDYGPPRVEQSGHVEIVGFEDAPLWKWAA